MLINQQNKQNNKATPSQISYTKALGIKNPERLSKNDISKKNRAS